MADTDAEVECPRCEYVHVGAFDDGDVITCEGCGVKLRVVTCVEYFAEVYDV